MDKLLNGWTVTVLTFDSRERERDEALMRAQVTVYRKVARIPQGRKRPVSWTQPVVRDAVMDLDAWEALKTVLEAAGATTTTTKRGW